MAAIQHLPYLGTAEDDVLFVAWRAEPGEALAKGDLLAVVETLKAAFDVEAEHDGVLLRQLVQPGERVAVQAPIAVLGDAGEVCDDATLARLGAAAAPTRSECGRRDGPALFGGGGDEPGRGGSSDDDGRGVGDPGRHAGSAASKGDGDTGSEGGSDGNGAAAARTGDDGDSPPRPAGRERRAAAAPAARQRARELGVDLAAVRGTGAGGLIRVEDVERARRGSGDGRLDEQFLRHLRADAAAFAALASEFKVALYQRHGARIGAGCRIGRGTVLLAERLVLGDGASFGDDCRLEAREFAAGELLHFGARCRIRVGRAAFGDNAFVADDVDIGGGGAMDPEALLQVGSHGFVGEHVHLNPCRPIVIGDEVVIARNAVLMTHSFGASALHGYPHRFAPVRVGDRAQIGIGAVLFPGSEVGEGAILLSGSSLVSAVPAGRLFGGVPAKDLKAAARSLPPAAQARLLRELLLEFARQLQLRGRAVAIDDGERLQLTLRDGGRLHWLGFHAAGDVGAAPAGAVEDVRVAMTFAAGVFDALPATVVAIELAVPRIAGAQGPLADALREFLRKRGVRLEPRSWTYRGGWL